MSIFTLEAGTTDVSSMEGVYSFVKSIFTTIITLLGNLYETITGTPLLFITIVISFAGGLLLFALSILRKLGVGNGGRRRGRR